MIIIAGTLRVHPDQRELYLSIVAKATAMARDAPGCLAFTQSADPLEADCIQIFERWESDEQLMAFRSLPADSHVKPPAILGASVHKYRVSAVEPP